MFRFLSRSVLFFCFFCLHSCVDALHSDEDFLEKHYYSITSSEALKKYFHFDYNDDDVIISGHRGGVVLGYAENCIETFDHLLYYAPFFFEIDVRLTQDGKIVLFHDGALDRLSTGTGKLIDTSYPSLENVYLKDYVGNTTHYKIPLLEDVLKWSMDKTILNLDNQNVPLKQLVELIDSIGAKNCIFSVYSVNDALHILNLMPDALFSVVMKTENDFNVFKAAGLLDHVVIAYLGTVTVENKTIVSYLHNDGIRCMVSTVPDEEKGYSAICSSRVLDSKPDIIETNYPIEYSRLQGTRRHW